MAALMPKVFRQTGEPVLVNYNFEDIADGTGIVAFQGLTQVSGSAILYSLKNSTENAYSIYTTGGSVSSGNRTDTYNFNLNKFNAPRTVTGTATIRLSFVCQATGGNDSNVHLTLTLQRVRDGVTTDIGACQTQDIQLGTTGAEARYITSPIGLTETGFAKGDYLNLKVEMYAAQAGGGGSTIGYFAHDPANRELGYFSGAATWPTKLGVDVPFDIEE